MAPQQLVEEWGLHMHLTLVDYVCFSCVVLVMCLFGLGSSLCLSPVLLCVASAPWKLHFPGSLVHWLLDRFGQWEEPTGNWEWESLPPFMAPASPGQLPPCFHLQGSIPPRQPEFPGSDDTISALCPSSPKGEHIFLIFDLHLCSIFSSSKTSVTRSPSKMPLGWTIWHESCFLDPSGHGYIFCSVNCTCFIQPTVRIQFL